MATERSLRGSAGEWLALALAVIIGLPSLLYPFGRDQALYQYVAARWLEGRLPYSATFDQKPPLLYALHGVSVLVFGNNQWGIRVLDLCAVILMGVLASRLLGARRVGPGSAALLSTSFYLTTFDYWCTAQAEIWEGLLLLAALFVVSKRSRPRLAAWLGGVLAGGAVMFKFPALVICGAMALISLRGKPTICIALSWRGFAWVVLGGGTSVVIVLFPWFAAGETSALWEALVLYNLAYARKVTAEVPLAVFGLRYAGFFTAVAVTLVSVALLRTRLQRGAFWRGLGELAILLTASVASVVIQRKYYGYHWGVVTPWITALLVSTLGAAVAGSKVAARWVAIGVALGAIVLAPPWMMADIWSYRDHVVNAARYVTGSMDREVFLAPFTGPYAYSYLRLERLATIVNERKVEGDELCVMAFEPAIYSLTGLICPTRFPATFPLDDPRIDYRKKALSDEYRTALSLRPPRFLVAPETGHWAIPASAVARYRPVARGGGLLLLEKERVGPWR